MSEVRYCKSCRKETRHDVWRELLPGSNSMAQRIFFGVASFGASELFTDKVAKCQRCASREVIG